MSSTFCDFYSFRARCEHQEVVDRLRLAFGGIGGLLTLNVQPGGWHGYASRGLLELSGVQVGMMAWGGEQQLGWVYASLSGAGCNWVQAWDYFEANTQGLPEFGFRRVDLALDVVDGSCSHDRTTEAFRAGGFDKHGHRPTASRIEPEDRRLGCTFYVGSRKGWQFGRLYDKGCEIRAKSGMPGMTHIDGIPVEDRYRLEVEFKATDGTVLPLDLVSDRDRYFAGAYPYFAEVLKSGDHRRITTSRKFEVHADITRGLANCQRMFGPVLLAAEKVYGSRDAVWKLVVGDRITDRWIAAGALIAGDGR